MPKPPGRTAFSTLSKFAKCSSGVKPLLPPRLQQPPELRDCAKNTEVMYSPPRRQRVELRESRKSIQLSNRALVEAGAAYNGYRSQQHNYSYLGAAVYHGCGGYLAHLHNRRACAGVKRTHVCLCVLTSPGIGYSHRVEISSSYLAEW